MSIPSTEATLAFKSEATLGECPVWDEQVGRLYWIDIISGKLCRCDPSSGENVAFAIGSPVGSFALRQGGQGAIIATEGGFAFLGFDSGETTPLSDPEPHLPGNRFNDGKCDPKGRFWAGTLSCDNEKDAGSLYCINSTLNITKKWDHLTCSNGMAWDTDDHIFYLIDSVNQTIHCFDYDLETGGISNQSVVAQLDYNNVLPDGMTIDTENKLWVALYNGSAIIRLDPSSGDILYKVNVPVPQVTSCTFGGPDFRELYITTAREGMSQEEIRRKPLSGSVFKAEVPFYGSPASRFAGKKSFGSY